MQTDLLIICASHGLGSRPAMASVGRPFDDVMICNLCRTCSRGMGDFIIVIICHIREAVHRKYLQRYLKKVPPVIVSSSSTIDHIGGRHV